MLAIPVDTSAGQLFCAATFLIPVLTFRKENPMCFHLRSGYAFQFLDSGKLKSRYTTPRMTEDFSPVLIRNAM